jgi:SecD/SecF fusion protein
MKRNNLWRFLLVILIVAWALFESYPPTNQDMIQAFRSQAGNVDATFGDIVAKAQELSQKRPDREYANLQEAIGTNDITRYFPQFTNSPAARTHPTIAILNRIQHDAMGRIHLGIDLQGGVSFLVQMDTNRLVNVQTNSHGVLETNVLDVPGAISQAVEVLRKRVDKLGVAEPVIQPEGSDRISIQLPGLSEAQMAEAEANISKVAYLEFYIVHPQSTELIRQGITPPGYRILSQEIPGDGGKTITDEILIRKPGKADMVGGISSAWPSRDEFGRPIIEFQVDSAHVDQFAKLTGENIHQRMAVVLDGELQSAPTIQSQLIGRAQITGNYTPEEAQLLANVLNNPLQAPIHIIDKNEVEPTLGKDTIHSGVRAAIYGILAVSAFMICYYFLSGFIANIALITNVVILIGIIAAAEQTLTLPGIAGLVLTVGMAVDANVLIYERIREEKAKGKSLRGAVDAGYDRAFGTIFDSHVTTLISAVVLWWLGTGSIKGFGFSLTWGVAASLFTSLVVTRLVFDFLINRDLFSDRLDKMLHLIPATMKLDFMKVWPIAAGLSWALIAVGMTYGVAVRGHDVFGVEFTGGEKIKMTVDSQHKPGVDQIRKIAQDISGREALVAYQHNVATGADSLQVTVRASETNQTAASDKIFQELKKTFPDAGFGEKPLSVTQQGPIVGEEISETAVIASLVAVLGILFYVAVRYEFTFALGAVIAIVHDVLMTLGVYFMAGRELNATTVAAVLTIIGFSINDTIVIFDRIREDLRLGVRGTFREVMNQALNQTLSRTIITSGTVFIATLSLLIFGGGEINDFAFTFLIGIITGTYSSIYIASAFVLLVHKGQRPNIGSATQTIVEPAVKTN